MSKKLKKTNAVRILDGLKIDYEIKTYEVDESDLSAVHVAQVSGLDIEMIALKELLPLTGYVRGGCSPLGAKKNYPVYLDARALTLEKISISAGLRGMQIVLSPQDLIKAVNATVAELVQ